MRTHPLPRVHAPAHAGPPQVPVGRVRPALRCDPRPRRLPPLSRHSEEGHTLHHDFPVSDQDPTRSPSFLSPLSPLPRQPALQGRPIMRQVLTLQSPALKRPTLNSFFPCPLTCGAAGLVFRSALSDSAVRFPAARIMRPAHCGRSLQHRQYKIWNMYVYVHRYRLPKHLYLHMPFDDR